LEWPLLVLWLFHFDNRRTFEAQNLANFPSSRKFGLSSSHFMMYLGGQVSLALVCIWVLKIFPPLSLHQCSTFIHAFVDSFTGLSLVLYSWLWGSVVKQHLYVAEINANWGTSVRLDNGGQISGEHTRYGIFSRSNICRGVKLSTPLHAL
jgi:hypothetical protein